MLLARLGRRGRPVLCGFGRHDSSPSVVRSYENGVAAGRVPAQLPALNGRTLAGVTG